MTTQDVTVSATQKARANIGQFLLDFAEKCKRVESIEVDDIDPRQLTQIRTYLKQIYEEKRREKIHNYICSDSDKEGTLLDAFTNAWFSVIRVSENNADEMRMSALQLIYRKLKTSQLSVHIFVSIYNCLLREIEKCSSNQLRELTKFIDSDINTENDPTKRWRDCVLLLLTNVKRASQIPLGSSNINGADFIENVLHEWLISSACASIFRHVVSIAISLDSKYIVERFLTNHLLEHIEDDDQKEILSWKAICLLEIVPEKLCERLLRTLTTVWPYKINEPPKHLFFCMELISKTLSEHPDVSKTFMNIFKSQKGEMLTSEFAFTTLMCICGIDRYKYSLFPSVKRTLHKLWKFDDEIKEIGWLESCNSTDYPHIIKNQIENIVDLFVDANWWKLLGTPILCLSHSMLEGPSSKEVIIVDGRVAGGPDIWIFSKTIMLKCMLSQHSAIETHLTYILQAIAATSTLDSALVLIDILLEIVKKCSVEVLSNWKLLDGLFEFVCRMRRDVAISLIRCLLPIISNRSQLREALFRSLKKDLIDPSKVTAAVPILLLLLRSVSKRRTAAMREGQMSQSFGSFSTQCLSQMGLKRGTDDAMSLEIVGILKRCLTQPITTKIAFYEGVSEAASRSPSLIAPFLEMLISHASTTPAWTPEAMVASSQQVTFLREPMPHLIQAMEILMCETLASPETENASQASDVLVNRVNQLLSTWVADAAMKDMTDLSLDKLSEWDPSTRAGRQTLIFSHMMISLYNMLIEHVWRRVAVLSRPDDKDYLIAILNRRKELQGIVSERTIRRKETKARATDKKMDLDLEQCEIFTSADTISEMLNKIMDIEENTHELFAIKEELLNWCIERACTLSKFLSKSHHPLHSMISNTGSLANVAHKLMTFYTGSECVEWIREIASHESSKTNAIVSYSQIIQFFCHKFASYPERVTQIWNRTEQEGSAGSAASSGSGGINGMLVRHVHLLMARTFPSIIILEKVPDDQVEKRKRSNEYEKQSKAIISAATAIMSVTNNRKTYNAVLKFVLKTLEKLKFSNGIILRDVLKFISLLTLHASDTDHLVSITLCTLADDVLEHLSEEGDSQVHDFIDEFSRTAVCDFLVSTTEKILTSVRQVVVFAGEFFSKDASVDVIVSHAITKCEECSDIVSRLLRLHTQFNIHKESIAHLLTSLYSSLDAPVEMLLNNHKVIPEMVEWDCLEKLSKLLKTKIHSIMAIADEHVGLLAPNELKSNSKKLQVAKAKRDETTYVKYVKTRETLQSRVLLLCRALKDDRLDLQIRGNSIGMRDFRINQNIFEANIAAQEHEDDEEDDSDEDKENESNPSKKAKLAPAEEDEDPDSNDVTMPEEEEADSEGDSNMSKVY